MVLLLLTGLIIYLIPICQSAIISEIFPSFIKPDLMIILIVYWGVSNTLFPGAVKTLAGGLFYDSLSGSPFALFGTLYLEIFFLIKLLEKILILGETKLMQITLVSSALFFQYLTLPFLLLLIGIGPNYSLPKINWLWPQVITTGLMAWPCFEFFKRILVIHVKESSSAP